MKKTMINNTGIMMRSVNFLVLLLFAVAVIMGGCKKPDDDNGSGGNGGGGGNNGGGGGGNNGAVELTSPINESMTLKDLGKEVDYVYNGNRLLEVTGNAVLTIEPGVTIKFTNKNGGIKINELCQIEAIGTAEKPIKFIGESEMKGSWSRIEILSFGDNRFKYCNFIGGGSNAAYAVIYQFLDKFGGPGSTSLGMEYCNIKGSLGYGYYVKTNYFNGVTAFNHNTISGCDKAPVYVTDLAHTQKFDLTSDFTGNKQNYIHVYSFQQLQSITLNELNVPYYWSYNTSVDKQLTINEGVTICVAPDCNISVLEQIKVKGTEQKPVTFTRLPEGAAYYWDGITFTGDEGEGYVLNWCIIEYCKSRAAISVVGDWFSGVGGKVTLNNVTIRNNQQYGVEIRSNNCKVIHSGTNHRFFNNTKGNVLLPDGTVSDLLP